MTYHIAVGSSDGKNVDLKFGEVRKFLIFTVENGKYSFSGIRPVKEDAPEVSSDCNTCATGNGMGCGMGDGHGCKGPDGLSARVATVADCRCVVVSRAGFQVQKQLEKKAISIFDIECPVTDALEKITYYYDRVDNHISLRR